MGAILARQSISTRPGHPGNANRNESVLAPVEQAYDVEQMLFRGARSIAMILEAPAGAGKGDKEIAILAETIHDLQEAVGAQFAIYRMPCQKGVTHSLRTIICVRCPIGEDGDNEHRLLEFREQFEKRVAPVFRPWRQTVRRWTMVDLVIFCNEFGRNRDEMFLEFLGSNR